MQHRPDKATLLDAVVQFLAAEVHPTVADKALAFRVLIAANLCAVVAAELRAEDDHDAAELTRLRALLPDVDAGPGAHAPRRSETHAALLALNRALCERIRAGATGPDVWRHVRATLREQLAVANPRFDASDEIE
jgi:hypothetical protein